MKRNLRLAFQHMRENWISVVVIMVELVVVLCLAAIFVSSFLEAIRKEQMYQHLQLSGIAEVKEEDVPVLSDNVQIINDEKREFQVEYEGKLLEVNSGSAAYFSCFDYPLRKGSMPDADNTSVIQGIFTDAMKDYFQVGQTYTLTDDRTTIQVLMVGQLQSNYIYGDVGYVVCVPNQLLIYDGGGLLPQPAENYKVTVLVEDEAALTEKEREVLHRASEYHELTMGLVRQEQGTPLVFGILILVLGFATFAGYNFIQMLQKERNYSVYYLCGASWKDCVQMQFMEDILTVGIPLCVTTIFLYVRDFLDPPSGSRDYMLSWEGFGVMVGICLLTFLLTSLEGILRLRKKSPVAIIEKWNQT